MVIVKMIMAVIFLSAGIIFITLVRNDANLLEQPGIAKRLGVFLTMSSASTMDDHPFAELRTPVFDMDAEKLYRHVLISANAMGWGVAEHDSDALTAHFIVRSPVLLFEDEVFVQVRGVNSDKSSLYIESTSGTSYIGADFAANSGHIQKLIEKLRKS